MKNSNVKSSPVTMYRRMRLQFRSSTGEKHKADKEYLWMVRSVMERLVIFHYDGGSRAGAVIESLANQYNFKGYLQCDGFAGYETAFKTNPDVRLLNCLVHIRRHFEQALDENRRWPNMH